MRVGFYRESAQIIPFPLKKSRFSAMEERERAIPDVCAAALDSCWYHSDAIREADKPAVANPVLRPLD
nr:DUF2735 domain-containing protein [Rhizobium alarense]